MARKFRKSLQFVAMELTINLFVKSSQISKENTFFWISLWQSCRSKAWNYIKKDTPAYVFSCEFAILLTTSFCRTPLGDCFKRYIPVKKRLLVEKCMICNSCLNFVLLAILSITNWYINILMASDIVQQIADIKKDEIAQIKEFRYSL